MPIGKHHDTRWYWAKQKSHGLLQAVGKIVNLEKNSHR